MKSFGDAVGRHVGRLEEAKLDPKKYFGDNLKIFLHINL
jgi:hypothetical protein